MEKEISLLVDSLAGAGETLTDYINQRVEEIDQMHQLKLEKLSVLAENHATLKVFPGSVQIQWKF